MKRKICVVTGSRAEYGLLLPLLNAVKKSPRLDLQLIVTGMHLLRDRGYTIALVRRDGFHIDAVVPSVAPGDDGLQMALSVANATAGIAKALAKLKPDFLVILGDRTEVLAAATAAAYLNIPIAHLHGGDVGSGCIDNQVRDAVTKLANLHFAASRKSAARIRALGEEAWRVFQTGSTGIDFILGTKLPAKRELFSKFGLAVDKPLIVVAQHPVTTEVGAAAGQMAQTMRAIAALEQQALVLYPNSDAGADSMIKVINQYRRCPFIRIIPNLPHHEYLGFLKYASVLVGNSSSGVIESASFGLPVVNIGLRQQGRERSANVRDVPHRQAAIRQAISQLLPGRPAAGRKYTNVYGDGRAAQRIVRVLSGIKLGQKLLLKSQKLGARS